MSHLRLDNLADLRRRELSRSPDNFAGHSILEFLSGTLLADRFGAANKVWKSTI
jgi:hypothetical protein